MRHRNESVQQKITHAARQLFLARGYTATSMEAIAGQAGVTKQTLYRYFADKRALFLSVIDDVMRTPREPDISLEKLQSLDDLRAILYKLGSHINAVIAEPDYMQLLRVVIAETITDPSLGQLFERGVTARALRSLTALFSSAKKNGLIDVERPGTIAHFFIGGFVTRIFLQGLLVQSGKKYLRRQTKAELSKYIEEFMRHIQAT